MNSWSGKLQFLGQRVLVICFIFGGSGLAFATQDTGSVSTDVVRSIKQYVAKEKQARANLLKIIQKGDKSGVRDWDSTCLEVRRMLDSIDLPEGDATNNRWLKEEKDNWKQISDIGGKIAYSNSFLQTELSELKRDYLQSQRDAKEVPKTVSDLYERLTGSFGKHMSRTNDLEEKAQDLNKWINGKEAEIDIPTKLDDFVGECDQWVESLDDFQARYRSIRKFSDGLYRYFYENKTELRDECQRQMGELRRNVKRLVSKKLTTDPASEYRAFEKAIEQEVLDRLDSYSELFEDWDEVNKPLMRTLSEFNEDYVAPRAADVLKGLPAAFLGVKVPKFAYDPDGSMDAVLDRMASSYRTALRVWRNQQYELLELKLIDLSDQMEILASEHEADLDQLKTRYESLIASVESDSKKFVKTTTAKRIDLEKRLQGLKEDDMRREEMQEDIEELIERMDLEQRALETRVERLNRDWSKQKQVLLDNYRDQLKWLKEQLDNVGK